MKMVGHRPFLVGSYITQAMLSDYSLLVQMLPLIKRSADTLVEKMDELAESGESTDVMM